MVETGFPYSNDYLPDLNVLEEMLDKSPIKYIPQVPRYPCATHSSRVQSSARHSSLPPIHLGKDTSVTDAGPGGPACTLQAGSGVLPCPQGPECACPVSVTG